MKYTVIAVTCFVMMACKENPKTERTNGYTTVLVTREDSLLKEVMDGHDIGMSKMMKLSKYQKKVKEAIDSINLLPGAKRDKLYLQTLTGLKEELEYAEFSMNQWMEGFRMDSLKDQPSLRLTYLEDQKATVTKVKAAILGSLSKADSLFNRK